MLEMATITSVILSSGVTPILISLDPGFVGASDWPG